MVDSGADISIFKLNKVLDNHRLHRDQNCMISGISGNKIETFASTVSQLTFQNSSTIEHEFQLVDEGFPIFTDGILGRDFLAKFRCTIDYELWTLNFRHNNEEVNVPIEDNFDQGIILPERCEVIRNLSYLNISEDMLVCSQEIQPGIFCGNTLASPSAQYVKFINTTDKPVYVKTFTPVMKPLKNFKN